MRFLVIDDHPLFRESLRGVLERLFPKALITEAASARDAMKVLPEAPWTAILLDLDLPDRSGLDLLSDIHSLAAKSPVIVLSGMEELEFGRQVLKEGAAGFLPKTSRSEEIRTAINAVVAGRKYITPDLAADIAGHVDAPGGGGQRPSLSRRESEVLRLFGSGKTPTESAAILGLSVKTISTYRDRLLEKLQLTTTAALVRYAIVNGLVD